MKIQYVKVIQFSHSNHAKIINCFLSESFSYLRNFLFFLICCTLLSERPHPGWGGLRIIQKSGRLSRSGTWTWWFSSASACREHERSTSTKVSVRVSQGSEHKRVLGEVSQTPNSSLGSREVSAFLSMHVGRSLHQCTRESIPRWHTSRGTANRCSISAKADIFI